MASNPWFNILLHTSLHVLEYLLISTWDIYLWPCPYCWIYTSFSKTLYLACADDDSRRKSDLIPFVYTATTTIYSNATLKPCPSAVFLLDNPTVYPYFCYVSFQPITIYETMLTVITSADDWFCFDFHYVLKLPRQVHLVQILAKNVQLDSQYFSSHWT